MPNGYYSYLSQNENSFAISEPGMHLSRSSSSAESEGIYAKEPDRQSTARRSSRSGRGRSSMRDEMEEEGNSRSSMQRGNSKRSGSTSSRGRTADRSASRRSSTTARGGQKKSRRGFAAMSPEQQREIARKGGLTVSRNRRHMADIGRVGGEHSHGGRRARSRR